MKQSLSIYISGACGLWHASQCQRRFINCLVTLATYQVPGSIFDQCSGLCYGAGTCTRRPSILTQRAARFSIRAKTSFRSPHEAVAGSPRKCLAIRPWLGRVISSLPASNASPGGCPRSTHQHKPNTTSRRVSGVLAYRI